MRLAIGVSLLTLVAACAGFARAADVPPVERPPIMASPECTWSKIPRGEWKCESLLKLNAGDGDLEHQGHCTTIFNANGVIVTSFSVEIASPLDSQFPIYLVGLDINRKPSTIVLSGTFLSEKVTPKNVTCRFRATLKVK